MMTISQRPGRLSFSRVLSCVDCKRETHQGRIYPMSPLVWQWLPLCDEYINEPPGSGEPIALNTLRHRASEQLAVIQHLQCRKRRIARAYVRLRRQPAHVKMQHAMRRRLNRACKAAVMEVKR